MPKNLGHAGIAGIPLQNGLYAAAAGAILDAVFGTSRQISTGPSSGLAAVAASAVAVAGITGVQKYQTSFAAMITLVSGVLFLLLAVLRMGWIAQFLSRAVVTGFLFGAAIDVVIGELPKLTGTKATGSNPLQELWSWLGTLGDVQGLTVVVGPVALAVVFGLRVIAPRIPGALVLVVGGLLASWLFDLGAHGVALVGQVPRGLPALPGPRPSPAGGSRQHDYDSRRRRHPWRRMISPGWGGRSSCDASQSASWKVSRKAATPMHMSSSAASAVTIPTWITATSPLNFSGSAGRTSSRTASRHTGSTSGLGTGSSQCAR